jgi:hypothetical protein
MQVLLDGNPLSVSNPSLAGALATAAADAQRRGRIIVEVKADGVLLSGDKLGKPSNDPSTIKELRLLSAEPRALVRHTILEAVTEPRALVRHTILEAVTALESARTEQAAAAELIQSGDPEQALGKLQAAMITWQTVRDVVEQSAAVLRIDLDSLALPGVDEGISFKTATKDLLGHLKQMRTALDQQDWSALSDVVGYDLDAQVGVWKGLLVALSQHVSAMPSLAPKAAQG